MRISGFASALRTTGTLLFVWQAVVWIFAPPRFILPAPLEVAKAFARRWRLLFDNALVTFGEILIGLVAGAGLGFAVALGAAALPRLGRSVWPLILVLQAFPVFVLAPLLVLWFGFGMASKIVMTTLVIFFPVASSFADGLRRIDPDLLDATALTPATRWQALIHVRLPLALPAFFSGLRVAAPLAPLGAVIGEWVGASAGLGFVMLQANARMQTEVVFAAMTILALCTLALRRAVDLLAPLFTPWARENEPDAPRSAIRRDS